MSVHAAIKHSTSYKYDKLVSLSPQVIRLRPAPHSATSILAYSLKISPENHYINWQQDPFGNYLARVVFPEKVKEFTVDVEVIADMKVINPFDFFLEDSAEQFPFKYAPELIKDLAPYLEIQDNGPLLQSWVASLEQFYGRNTVDFLVAVNQHLYQKVDYTIRLEHGVQTPEETLGKALGSCRDSAWVLVQAFRHIGLAARFVSGYLVQLKADKKPAEGAAGPEEDFTDLHAWCEVYIPGAGWVGLDATSGLFAGEGHIPLCCTPDPGSASPITGFAEPAQVEFNYSNDVVRIHEDPRVTKPYSDDQWAAIDQLGQTVDAQLEQDQVHLTMGGEPTFVSASDMESEQWNTDADGEDKRTKAFQMMQALNASMAGGQGLNHIGQGKWYPGEPVPRWNYTIYWRKDGLPIVNDSTVYDDPTTEGDYTYRHAEALMKGIADEMKLPAYNIEPGYEDVFFYLWQENKLPVNVDPLRVNMKDTLERRTMSNLLLEGMNDPVGFALPLDWDDQTEQWISCVWEFRQPHMFLVPGNSPMGLRLPLNSLPHMVPAQRKKPVERSPFESLPPLENYQEQVRQQQVNSSNISKPGQDRLNPPEFTPKSEEEDDDFFVVKKAKEAADKFEPEARMFTISKAISVEARKGKLYVFFPPLDYVEHYLELLAVVEKVASALSVKILVEGYPPPRDNRVESLAVTPDPGVIEVNIHPSTSWEQTKGIYTDLFEAATKLGLGTEKFMLDGRHVGSGGGHHITLGGVTPDQSPLLRRPDLLKSFILFWQNHPGLSYLFSTAFIGPTSQAPRVDEGKADQLYELQIALDQISKDKEVPNWLTDRLLRNLLTDLTGNTHRAEFCIDKLYSPDSSSGRLGILELRAFEMPPDERMCLVQLLLIRTLVAWFWKQPYEQSLVDWGTELHDKFMLHHYVKKDLEDICDQLNAAGYPFDVNWLEPFFEFRFPLAGRINHNGIELAIRNGIEPWQVLGEEMSSSGTARFVDSSMERVEIKVSGINTERYVVLCNEQRVPLVSTGQHQEYVTGIRYKAWAPPSALHPVLPVDVPLVFDIYDLWSKKSIGGCVYHVAHPGGRNYSTYPVNANEAEARRESRFFNFGHTQHEAKSTTTTQMQEEKAAYRYVDTEYKGSIQEVPETAPPSNPAFPYTFDLRKSRV